MPIVTFWNDERDQTGKTLTAVAVATRMAIERNYKILLISTSFQDPTIKNCFWGDETQKTLKLGLFDTINDTDFTSEESDVTAGKIAPGTTGQFEIAKLINNSDVNAQYKITYSIDNNNNIPLEFSKDKNAADSEWKSLSDFSMNNFEALSKDSTEGVSTGTIYWRWKFERNDDSADTDFGINTPEVVVTATITVEQVD